VLRNDKTTVGKLKRLQPDRIVISPGPSTPQNAGISNEVVKRLGSTLPVLGVCLGHQCIGYTYGGIVVPAKQIMHGKSSRVHHENEGLFRGLSNPFYAIRYHSLIVNRDTLPDCLEVTAWTDDGTIMGLRHREYPVEGIQFHPESFMTQGGKEILKNFLKMRCKLT
jgi:anthranilate synthase component 2